jgi:hypothetical protein
MACDTRDCFTDNKIFWRDNQLDKLLTASIPSTNYGEAKVLKLAHNSMMLKQIVKAILGEKSDNLELLGNKFVASGKTFGLNQIEKLVIAFHSGDNSVPLLVNGYPNVFFVHDDKGIAYVLYVSLDEGKWDIRIGGLDNKHKWDHNSQFFLLN